MAGISYSTLVTQIRNYTEVDSNVLRTRNNKCSRRSLVY